MDSLKNHWKDDIVAGFVVFLIALPLSLGIAVAAGAPASAGILSAILGGILATFITGAHITISGPAAGLIVVILGSIQSLGGGDVALGFKRTLAAVAIAGALQVLVGLFRGGSLAFLAPTAVVHGMLAAIGMIIMIKQIPVMFGVKPEAHSIVGLILEIPRYISELNWPVFIIAISCFSLFVIWGSFLKRASKIVPAALITVLVGLGFSFYLGMAERDLVSFFGNSYVLGSKFLVQVPMSFKELFIFPLFDVAFTTKGLMAMITIFIVGSLESLLSAYAIDKLDPYKRKTNLNKDLIGKGVVNIFCGLLGAYPIITEIVRSSADISNGAKTIWSNFFHGIFIFLFVFFFPGLLNHIPLAALAAILFVVGFNLAHPKEFMHVYHTGKDQFLLFMTTLVVTIVEDLLVGIAAGIVLKIIMHVFRGVKFKDLFAPKFKIKKNDNKVASMTANSPMVFLGYLKIKAELDSLEEGQRLVFENNGYYVDFTISELIKEYS